LGNRTTTTQAVAVVTSVIVAAPRMQTIVLAIARLIGRQLHLQVCSPQFWILP
jgi:hypothetical protein